MTSWLSELKSGLPKMYPEQALYVISMRFLILVIWSIKIAFYSVKLYTASS